MALTDTAIKAFKSGERPQKKADGKGLYLLVMPGGGRLWRLKYWMAGKELLLALGSYPDVPLKRARDLRDEARRHVAEGKDPNALRREARAANAHTFEGIAREWLLTRKHTIASGTYDKKLQWLTELVFPSVGSLPIAAVTGRQLLHLLKKIEARGQHETAHRVRSLCGNVFRYAMAAGLAQRDITSELRGALAPVVTTSRSAITFPDRIGDLMRAIDVYRGQPATRAALQLAPLTFVRPRELRFAEWREFDLDSAEPSWRIPAARMKMRREHLVPLAPQSVAVMRELRPITGAGTLAFPSIRGNGRPISENTINAALQNLGFGGDEITGHGFRAMASTALNEKGYPPDVIALQLAHAEQNEVRAAYNRAIRMSERRAMMAAWANYLDELRLKKPSVDAPAAPEVVADAPAALPT